MKTKPKSILSLLCLLATTSFFTGCGETSPNEIQFRKGMAYQPNQDKPFTGRVVSRYMDGQKSEEANFKDGLQHGLFTVWLPNGQMCHRETFKNGKSDGEWTEWYPNGQRWESGNYKEGKKEGRWTTWDEVGQKSSEGIYLNDNKHGRWIHWCNGEIEVDSFYNNGKKEGEWTEWWCYADGRPKRVQINFKDDKKDGLRTEWHDSGQIFMRTHYVDGKKHGTSSLWRENGEISFVENYQDDVLHGMRRTWRNGQVWQEQFFVNGELAKTRYP